MKKISLIVIILIILVIGLCVLKSNNTSTITFNQIYKDSDLFTDRDLKQTANISQATQYTVSNGSNINITSAGVYVISGTSQNSTIYIEAGEEDNVQLVLESLNITNNSTPCIYVKTASKVFITSVESNNLKVIGTFLADETNNLNGVIFSKQDITLNGAGTLNIESTQNGITGKDDIKITGGTYNITALVL